MIIDKLRAVTVYVTAFLFLALIILDILDKKCYNAKCRNYAEIIKSEGENQ